MTTTQELIELADEYAAAVANHYVADSRNEGLLEKMAVARQTLLDHIESLSAAERTLVQLGYTNNGGEYWKPPLGKAPSLSFIENAKRYTWLKENCVRVIDGHSDGPDYKQLQFSGKFMPDWKSALDHFGLDTAIDMEIANGPAN